MSYVLYAGVGAGHEAFGAEHDESGSGGESAVDAGDVLLDHPRQQNRLCPRQHRLNDHNILHNTQETGRQPHIGLFLPNRDAKKDHKQGHKDKVEGDET